MADDDQDRRLDVLWTVLTVALWITALILAAVLLRMTFFD
jgi:hypothetical protein